MWSITYVETCARIDHLEKVIDDSKPPPSEWAQNIMKSMRETQSHRGPGSIPNPKHSQGNAMFEFEEVGKKQHSISLPASSSVIIPADTVQHFAPGWASHCIQSD